MIRAYAIRSAIRSIVDLHGARCEFGFNGLSHVAAIFHKQRSRRVFFPAECGWRGLHNTLSTVRARLREMEMAT